MESFWLAIYMEVSEPKWVNHVLKAIGVNSLRLGGLHLNASWFILLFGGLQLISIKLTRLINLSKNMGIKPSYLSSLITEIMIYFLDLPSIIKLW